jgi:hypothetical protein
MAGTRAGHLTEQAAHLVIDRRQCHRRVSPEAGRALEILGHAIEYVTDEFVHAGGAISAHCAPLDAVQILMALNREIYFECPITPTLGQRCLTLLHLRSA